MDMQERKAFLADAMGHIYTELFIGNHRYGYCNRGNGTVEFWRGGYLSARAKTTLTLLEVAERAAQLIEQMCIRDRYYTRAGTEISETQCFFQSYPCDRCKTGRKNNHAEAFS